MQERLWLFLRGGDGRVVDSGRGVGGLSECHCWRGRCDYGLVVDNWRVLDEWETSSRRRARWSMQDDTVFSRGREIDTVKVVRVEAILSCGIYSSEVTKSG